jgi:hypothetical protein
MNREMNLHDLRLELERLQTAATEIRAEGDILQGVRLDKAAAGGTASPKAQQTYKYARLRAGRGKLLPNGKGSRYVPLSDIPKTEVAIARGQRLTKVEKAIAQVRAKVEKLQAKAAALGVG